MKLIQILFILVFTMTSSSALAVEKKESEDCCKCYAPGWSTGGCEAESYKRCLDKQYEIAECQERYGTWIWENGGRTCIPGPDPVCDAREQRTENREQMTDDR